MDVIVFTRPDGGTTVVIPAYNDRIGGKKRGESQEAYLAYVAKKSIPDDATNIHICDDSAIPQDRTFRNAWEQGVNKVPEVSMPKARVLHMDRIRLARNTALAVLDIETMKGRDVQAEKQVLRDIPQTFDLSSATTPEALKALIPDGLEM